VAAHRQVRAPRIVKVTQAILPQGE
jgi:hypothetical protein